MLREHLPTLMLRNFHYAHLPEKLQAVSKPFFYLAESIVHRCSESNPDYMQVEETISALRKLMEAKDCAVRSQITALK